MYSGRDVPGVATDDHAEFDLVVHLFPGRVDDGGTGIRHTRRCFPEKQRFRRWFLLLLLGVVVVIQADTDDLPGVRNGRENLHGAPVEFRERSARTRLPYRGPIARRGDVRERRLASKGLAERKHCLVHCDSPLWGCACVTESDELHQYVFASPLV